LLDASLVLFPPQLALGFPFLCFGLFVQFFELAGHPVEKLIGLGFLHLSAMVGLGLGLSKHENEGRRQPNSAHITN
jgi:hypothetical protein